LQFTLAIHGGAGAIGLDDPDKVKKYLDGMRAVLQAGHELLSQGGSCLDAVERCVRMLEDDPQWNAGVGAVMTASGEHELDASIMAGQGRRAGSAAGVKTVRNPISLARAVMEKSPHVMLAGVGADAFAKVAVVRSFSLCFRAQRFQSGQECKLEIVPNSTFSTEARRQALKNAQVGALCAAGSELTSSLLLLRRPLRL
jgi:isoaspartyl peptidase/L-asparaginase-like protein (Ntn-hydrolase superfamily)